MIQNLTPTGKVVTPIAGRSRFAAGCVGAAIYDSRFVVEDDAGMLAIVLDITTGEDFVVEVLAATEEGYFRNYDCSCGEHNCIHAAVHDANFRRSVQAEQAWMRRHER